MTTKKENRCFTIMIVPHSEETTFSIRLPFYFVQVVVVLLMIGVAGLSVLGYAYLMAAAEAREARALRQLNRNQQEEIDSLAIETERMIEHIQEVDELIEVIVEELEMAPGAERFFDNQPVRNPSNSESNNVNNFNPQNPAYFIPFIEDQTYNSRSSSGDVLDRTTGNIEFLKTVIPEHSDTLDALGEYTNLIRATPSLWPARGRISSGYGMRAVPYGEGYQFHRGVDIVGSHGSPIRVTANGKVVFSGYRGDYGNLVIVDHFNGYETYYAHLSGFAVNAGDIVEKGQIIGYMGRTGRTTGTHLHYEVRYEGATVNPRNYLHR